MYAIHFGSGHVRGQFFWTLLERSPKVLGFFRLSALDFIDEIDCPLARIAAKRRKKRYDALAKVVFGRSLAQSRSHSLIDVHDIPQNEQPPLSKSDKHRSREVHIALYMCPLSSPLVHL